MDSHCRNIRVCALHSHSHENRIIKYMFMALEFSSRERIFDLFSHVITRTPGEMTHRLTLFRGKITNSLKNTEQKYNRKQMYKSKSVLRIRGYFMFACSLVLKGKKKNDILFFHLFGRKLLLPLFGIILRSIYIGL